MSEEKRGPAAHRRRGRRDAARSRSALLEYVRSALNVPADIRNEVERRREGLETLADDAIERALRRLRIPTRKDIEPHQREIGSAVSTAEKVKP